MINFVIQLKHFGRIISVEVQVSLLALHSGITPYGAQGTISDAQDRTWTGCVQSNCISPQLHQLNHLKRNSVTQELKLFRCCPEGVDVYE